MGLLKYKLTPKQIEAIEMVLNCLERVEIIPLNDCIRIYRVNRESIIVSLF